MPDDLDLLLGFNEDAQQRVFERAAEVSPGDIARERRVSQGLGAPRQVIALDPLLAERRLTARDALNLSERTPAARAIAFREPDFAPVALSSFRDLNRLEEIWNDINVGIDRGRLSHQYGTLTAQRAYDGETSELLSRIATTEQRIEALRSQGTGGFIEAAAEVATQLIESIDNYEFDAFRRRRQERIAGSRSPTFLDPVTDTVITVGDFARHLVQDAFYQSAGPFYGDLLRAGVDKGTAKYLANIVGTTGAALDTVGIGALAALPALASAKAALRRPVQNRLRALSLKYGATAAAGIRAGSGYALGVGAETTTEGLQAAVEFIAENVGRELSGIDTVPTSELPRRVADAAAHAFKASVVLGTAGGISRFGFERAAARRTEQTQQKLDVLSRIAPMTPLATEAPDLAAQHVERVLAQDDIDRVYIPYRTAVEVLGRETLERAGVDGDALTAAERVDGDITIEGDAFAREVVVPGLYDAISDDIRAHEDGFTPREAREFRESGREAEAYRLLDDNRQLTAPPRRVDETSISDQSIAGESDNFFRPGALRGQFDLDGAPIDPARLSERGLAVLAEAQALADELTGGGTQVAFIRLANGAPAMFVHATGNILLNLDPSVAPVPGTPEASRHTVRGLITHESVHVLRLRGAIPAEDWSAVTAAAQENGWLELFDVHERYPGLSPEAKLEEAVAEAAAAYQAGERQSLGFMAEAAGALQRVLAAVGRLYQAGLRFLGLENQPRRAEDVVSGLTTGEFGSRLVDDYVPIRATAAQQFVANLEDALGLKALFRDAADAGMTPRQYETYIANWRRASEASQRRLQTRELNKRRRAVARLQREEGAALRREIIERIHAEQPAYQVLSQIEQTRLNRADIEAAGFDPEAFPTFARGRKIYTTMRDEPAIDIEILADVNDYDTPAEMLQDILTTPPIEPIVEREVANDPRTHELAEEASGIEADLELLAHDDYARVLTTELNALRAAGQGFTYREIRAFALQNIGRDRISDITPAKFERQERRHAKAAVRALRSGDVATAAREKFLQHINYEKMRAIYRTRHEIARKQRYLAQFTRRGRRFGALPPDSLQAIRTYLEAVGLYEADINDRINLQSWNDRVEARTGQQIIFAEPPPESAGRGIQGMRLEEFRAIEQVVRAIESIGRGVGKETREARQQRIDNSVLQIAASVVANIPVIDRVTPGLQPAIRNAVNIGGRLMATPRTIVDLMDGGAEQGPAFRALIEPYRRAMTDGFAPAFEVAGARMRAIWDTFTKAEQIALYDTLPRDQQSASVRTGAHRLGLLLNLGNEGNRQALIDGGVPEAEIEHHIENATQKEFEYAQAVWDLFNEYWPQVAETIRERRGEIPVTVEAVPLNTSFGQYRGGYYGIIYDSERNSRFDQNTDADEFRRALTAGEYLLSHTADGHTRERQGGGSRPIDLNPVHVNRLLERVLYDIHVGDSVRDAYEILNDPRMGDAFDQRGRVPEHQDLQAWLNDIAVGEIPGSGIVNMISRHMRGGLVAYALGYNLKTAALQPLGVANTIGRFGGLATMRGITTALRRGIPDTPTMRGRRNAFNADQEFIRNAITNSWLSRTLRRVTPGESASFLLQNSLWPIITAQRATDSATWYAGADYGKRKLGLSGQELVGFADQSVLDIQGTQIQGLRSAFERGTGGSIVQSDLVRAMAVFMNYFIAKNNIAIRRARNTPFRLGEIIGTGSSLGAMYLLEPAILVAIDSILRGDDKDDDDSLLGNVASGAFAGFMQGVPIFNQIYNQALGHDRDPLGIPLADAFEQIAQVFDTDEDFNIDTDEFDRGFFRATTRAIGISLRVAGGAQATRTIDAVAEAADGEDVAWWEYLFGVKR